MRRFGLFGGVVFGACATTTLVPPDAESPTDDATDVAPTDGTPDEIPATDLSDPDEPGPDPRPGSLRADILGGFVARAAFFTVDAGVDHSTTTVTITDLALDCPTWQRSVAGNPGLRGKREITLTLGHNDADFVTGAYALPGDRAACPCGEGYTCRAETCRPTGDIDIAVAAILGDTCEISDGGFFSRGDVLVTAVSDTEIAAAIRLDLDGVPVVGTITAIACPFDTLPGPADCVDP